MTNSLYQVHTDRDGMLAGMIMPTSDGKTSAFGIKAQFLGSFATISEAIAAVHAAW